MRWGKEGINKEDRESTESTEKTEVAETIVSPTVRGKWEASANVVALGASKWNCGIMTADKGGGVKEEGLIRKQLLAAALATILLAASAVAQSTSRPPAKSPTKEGTELVPTAEQLLDSAVMALGGAAAIHKISSRVMKGTFELPALGITGTAEVYAAAPDRFCSLVRIPEIGDFKQGFDGKTAWASDPNSGLREMAGEEFLQFVRHSQFFHDLRFRELYPQRRVTGKAKVGERAAWMLEATPAGESPETFYFDTETYLLLRHDGVEPTPDGKLSVEQYYEGYSTLDGVKIPARLRHVDPKATWTVTFTEVKHNVAIDAAQFRRPVAP